MMRRLAAPRITLGGGGSSLRGPQPQQSVVLPYYYFSNHGAGTTKAWHLKRCFMATHVQNSHHNNKNNNEKTENSIHTATRHQFYGNVEKNEDVNNDKDDDDDGPFYPDDTNNEDDFHHQDDDDEDDEDDDDEDSDHQEMYLQPWKTLVGIPARAAWRVSDPHLPLALSKSMETILQDGDRTLKQLKRAHRKVLELQNQLAEFRERERRRLVNVKPRQRHSPRLNNNRGGRTLNGDDDSDGIHPVYYGYDETLATLQHRTHSNFSIVRRVLEECVSLLGPNTTTTTSNHHNDTNTIHTKSTFFAPRRILDFGIGCGSASAAAMDLFLPNQNIEWIHGIDPSQPMRDCSQRLLEGMAKEMDGVKIAPRITFSTSLSGDLRKGTSTTSDASTTSGDGGGGGDQGSFDLALFAYTATELPDLASTLAAAALLFDKLKPNGILVMTEPGTPDGFNSVRAVRNMLLDCCPPHDPDFEWQERCHIIAPCTHNGSCPMVRHRVDFVQKGKLGHDVPVLDDAEEGEKESKKPSSFKASNDKKDLKLALGQGDTTVNESSGLKETTAFDSSFCSFVQTIPGSDSKGEKFSYLVAQKQLFRSATTKENENQNNGATLDSFARDNLSQLLAMAETAASQQDATAMQEIYQQAQNLESRYLDSDEDGLGLELLRGETKRTAMGRIIRAPIKKKGHVYIDYCASPGRILRNRVAKSTSNVAPGLWSAARKSRWGGLWPDTSNGDMEILTPKS